VSTRTAQALDLHLADNRALRLVGHPT
jgi:hypothetical protein